MSASRTHLYRLIKSSWGIRISITAEVHFRCQMDALQTGPGSPVWIARGTSEGKLSDADIRELAKGLNYVASEISDKVGGGRVHVMITDVAYVESDFQVEGLAVAMCRWAEAEFNLMHHEIVESYDRSTNRYTFEWPDLT